ncbi:MAG: hypothetical protein FOGNACKC_04134 [Anaerolineae bacterium]|nr:hypothetical protein [Anaerolineae bacterium]
MTTHKPATRYPLPASFLARHWRLAVILLIYLLAATAHSLIAPFTVGNDEYAHFLYARFITEHGRLPVTLAERQNREEAGTKADDPPLYHLLVAAASAGIEPTRLLRPVNGDPFRQLADNVVVSYAFVVHTAYESWPFAGEVAVWMVGRAISILCGLALIGLTYITSLTLFPRRYRRALTAAALLGFMPAFIFHTSVMTYDGLGAVLTALFLLAAIAALRRPARWRWWLALGGLAGLAITAKYTSVLLPLEIMWVGWLAWRQSGRVSFRAILARVVVAGLALLLAVSWWFGFIIYHFNTIDQNGPLAGVLAPLLVRGGNDTTAISLTAFLLGEQSVSGDLPAPARPRDYPQLAQTLFDSFWAARINEKYLLSPWLALAFTGLAGLSAAGLWRVWRASNSRRRGWLLLLLVHSLLVTPLMLLRLFISFDAVEAVQGRHILLPAATAIPLLLVWGWQRWSGRLRPVVVAGLLLWSVIGQVGWAALAYPGPLPVWTTAHPPAGLPRSELATPVDGLRLLAADWQPAVAKPALAVTLWWQAETRLPEDVRVELTLLDAAGQPVTFIAGQPLNGRYPTRAWEPGDIVRDEHFLPLTRPLPAGSRLRLQLLTHAADPVGWPVELGAVSLPAEPAAADPCAVWRAGQPTRGGPLHSPLRQREPFAVVSAGRPVVQWTGGEAGPWRSVGGVHVFEVQPNWGSVGRLRVDGRDCGQLVFDLPPRSFTAPQISQPVTANFNNQILLLGFDLPTRRIDPGQRLPLTLCWQALATMGEDYQMFDNLLDAGQRRWGGYDRRAKDGYSTLLWAPGEVITDAFGVPVDPAAPPGVYTIDLGWYRDTPQGAVSLPLLADGRPTGQTGLRLGPIKVGGPPPEVIAANPQPQHTVNQTFGGQIALLGYDVSSQRVSESAKGNSPNSPNSLTLTLYWRADSTPAADYTTFLHLRNAAGETVAQKDQPPAAGRYPTSLWDTGEVVVDELVLPLDQLPPGEYTPVVGLYELSSGARLATPGQPANEIALEQLTITNYQ